MAERTERVTRVVEDDRATVQPAGQTTEVREVSEASVSGATLAERVVWFITGALLVLLAFRFVLALLGANPNNAFADFIYTASYPFVAPFFGLFGYDLQYGVAKFETFTLIAMAVYAIFAWGIAKLLTLNRPR